MTSESPALVVRRLLVAVGVALALAAIWLPMLGGGTTYWDSLSTGVFLLVLTLGCAGLLAGDLLWRASWMLPAASLVGAILFGAMLLVPVLYAYEHLGDLRLGAWFGVAGGAMIVLARFDGVLISSAAGVGPEPPALVGARLVSGAGLVAVAVALWLPLLNDYSVSYWRFFGRHPLGVFLLCALGFAAALTGAAALTRRLALERLALAAALVVLGFTLFYPIGLAIDSLHLLGAGGWLAIAGALVAVAGALATLAFESRSTRPVEPGAPAARQ